MERAFSPVSSGLTYKVSHCAQEIDEMEPVKRICKKHGETDFRWHNDKSAGGRFRCILCQREYTRQNVQRTKSVLAAEAGGKCQICGYDKYLGALEFHHLDPKTKEFSLSGNKGSSRVTSLDRLRAEAKKCVLLCSNHHREVEAGIIDLHAHV